MIDIIDIRDPQSFAVGHLENSLNIPYSPAFFHWAKLLIPAGDKQIVTPNGFDKDTLDLNLKIMFPESLFTYITQSDLKEKATVPLKIMSPEEIDLSKHLVLDVRTPAEWNQGTLEGAELLELSKLSESFGRLDKQKSYAVICGSGVRSSTAASYLKCQGFKDVASVKGGMNAWSLLK